MMFQNSTDCVNRCREAPKRRTLELPGAGGLPWFRRGESSQESLKKLALSLVDTDPSFLKRGQLQGTLAFDRISVAIPWRTYCFELSLSNRLREPKRLQPFRPAG